MLKQYLTIGCLCATLALSSCAPISPFASDPADLALKQKVVASLGDYAQEITVSVAGGRVYLSGWVPNFNQKQDVLSRVESIEGVKDIKEDIKLTDPGHWGDGGANLS